MGGDKKKKTERSQRYMANEDTANNNNNRRNNNDNDITRDWSRVSMSERQADEQACSFRLLPMGVEPLSDGKTAIVTCMLKLPTGAASSSGQSTSTLPNASFVLVSAHVQFSSNKSTLSVYSEKNQNK